MQTAAPAVAAEIACLIRSNNRQGKPTVLGLATGCTPHPTYQKLIRLRRGQGLSFRTVTSFNLGGYLGLPQDQLLGVCFPREVFEKALGRTGSGEKGGILSPRRCPNLSRFQPFLPSTIWVTCAPGKYAGS